MEQMLSRAVAPAMTPPRFPDPVFYPARRIHGLVETPDEEALDASQTTAVNTKGNGPPSLVRRNSVTGNILLLEHPEEGTLAFLLQRKVATSAYGGSMRVGFPLQGENPGEDGLWHIKPKESSSSCGEILGTTNRLGESRKRDYSMMQNIEEQYEMVTIYVENETHLLGEQNDGDDMRIDNLKTEIGALQWIAQHRQTLHLDHLWESTFIGKERGTIYIVLPSYDKDGTLMDYCAMHPNGVLSLDEVKFFFKQILKGIRQLQSLGICHRSLSLDTVLLADRHCRISHFGSALRIPKSEDNDVAGQTHFITPQAVGGRFPESVAPELWAQEAFDGHAVDMWSAGIILWKMLVPSKIQLFAAPVPDDIRFREYCLEGKLKERLTGVGLPEEVVDILEGLLRVKSAERYTLDDIMGHPWLAD